MLKKSIGMGPTKWELELPTSLNNLGEVAHDFDQGLVKDDQELLILVPHEDPSRCHLSVVDLHKSSSTQAKSSKCKVEDEWTSLHKRALVNEKGHFVNLSTSLV